MNLHLPKKSILKKTFQVGALTLLSRMIAIMREVLQVRFFDIGALSDAFIMAFRIPNLFRHVFAEGALNASFVPVLVKTIKENKREQLNGVISLAFIFFQGTILLIYLFILLKSHLVVKFVAPGFSAEQAYHTGIFLKILFPFLFFVSGSALLSGPLNAINHFFIPTFGPALWNMSYVASLLICLSLKLSPLYLCWGVIIAGFIQFIMNLAAYLYHHFSFSSINTDAWNLFKTIMSRFLPGLLGVSIIEINIFVSGMVASFLPKGSVSLLYYGSRFMNLPLGVFAVAFASILLPHFSRIVLHAPSRMRFYTLEVAKFISWAIIPISIFFMLIAEDLFSTMFLMQGKGTTSDVYKAKWILIIYCTGLIFFCINKVLLNIFYSLKDTRSTTIISASGALINIIGDIIGMFLWGIYGIALASTLSGIGMTLLCFFFLKKKHGISFYFGNYILFLTRFIPQLLITGLSFLLIYKFLITFLISSSWHHFFTHGLGFLLLASGLTFCFFVALFATKKTFGLNSYFLK